MPARLRRSRTPTKRHGGAEAGFVLLDLVIALALFVIGGLAVLTQMESGARRVIDAEHRIGAASVARTALALLESGAMGDRELNGPATAWATPANEAGEIDPQAEWVCEVELEPSSWPELSLATVRVRRVPAGAEAENWPVLSTLRQLVPMDGFASAPGEEAAGGAP